MVRWPPWRQSHLCKAQKRELEKLFSICFLLFLARVPNENEGEGRGRKEAPLRGRNRTFTRTIISGAGQGLEEGDDDKEAGDDHKAAWQGQRLEEGNRRTDGKE